MLPIFRKKIQISSISHIIAQFCHHSVEREKSSEIDPLIIKIGYKMADLFNSKISKNLHRDNIVYIYNMCPILITWE